MKDFEMYFTEFEAAMNIVIDLIEKMDMFEGEFRKVITDKNHPLHQRGLAIMQKMGQI